MTDASQMPFFNWDCIFDVRKKLLKLLEWHFNEKPSIFNQQKNILVLDFRLFLPLTPSHQP